MFYNISMFYLLILFFIFLAIASLFSFKKFSPIPYFPTQKTDISLIIKSFNLKNNQTIIDFGAGDGIVIFQAAKKAFEKNLNVQFIAIEINPMLILILHLRRLYNSNKKNIKIVLADMFKIKLNSLIYKTTNSLTFYIYISPWLIDRLIKNIKKQTKKFNLISYMYQVNSLKLKKIIKGKNKIFIY